MRKAVTVLTDDIDGGEAVHQVRLTVDSEVWEWDMSEQNTRAMLSLLHKYLPVARRGRKLDADNMIQYRRKGVAPSAETATQVRKWAARNGMQVSSTGRLPEAVLAAFEEHCQKYINAQAG